MLRKDIPTDRPVARDPARDVARLKELLFDREAQRLNDLTVLVESVARADSDGRRELREAIEQVFERAGTDDKLALSVSKIIAPALRKAEVKDHTALADSIAPLVVSTIKTELRNSQDEMVEALYPITGRLVKSYVASAMRDLSDQMNRRLEQNPVMLRIQSLTTGRSVAELALAGAAPFDLTELYLIRRASGELVARWPQRDVSARDQALSGVLAAINEFANDALSAKAGSLRQIDLGSEIVYLRGSPLFLMAARCSGEAAPGLEQAIDDVFLDAIEQQTDADSGAFDREKSFDILKSGGMALKAKVDEAQSALANEPRSNGLLKGLAAVILLPLIGWFGYNAFDDFMNNRVEARAALIVASTPNMAGYPATFRASSRGRILEVKGLAPNEPTRRDVLANFTRALPGTNIIDDLTALPAAAEPGPDLSPDIAALKTDLASTAESIRRERAMLGVDRAIAKLTTAVAQLRAAAAAAPDDVARRQIATATANAEQCLTTLNEARTRIIETPDVEAIRIIFSALGDSEQEVAALFTAIASADAANQATTGLVLSSPNRLTPDIQGVEDRSEHIADLAISVALATRLKPPQPSPPAPAPDPVVIRETVAAPAPSPRERLEAVARAKAIFFANGTDYRDASAAKEAIDSIAGAIKAANVLVRIIGYTDEAGGNSINNPLARQRAELVRSELLSRDVPVGLLAVIGRADRVDISTIEGPSSPNRRVEFEVGFDGEALP